MKKIPINIFKKRLKCLLWLWIIVLFLTTYYRKIAKAKTIFDGNKDHTSVNLVQKTNNLSRCSFVQGKDQSYSKFFAYVQQKDESDQAESTIKQKLIIASSSQRPEADIYEEDDQPAQAWPIVVNNPAQLHTFHTDTDTDWVYFFGHASYRYDMSAVNGISCDHSVTLSLADPNGKILTIEAGIPVQSTTKCHLGWSCQQNGYYFLKIEPPSEYPPEGISYELSIEDDQAVLHTSILGRVVNSKHEGINELLVYLVDSGNIIGKKLTGSIENILDNNLDPSKIDGWYFFIHSIEGRVDLRITEDDPNVILGQVLNINLSPHTPNRIEDIVLDYPNGEEDVISDFDLLYTKYQNEKGKDYPVSGDNDKDGATNLDEFLYGTDLDDPNNMPFNLSLSEGWSMISIPLISEIVSLSELFPDSEVVYKYEKGSGYKRVEETEELEVGRGYWILLKEEKNYTLTGRPIHSYILSLNEERWEMIGGCTYAAKVLVDSCNIVVIYRYDNEGGYQRVPSLDVLEPGKGYWILLNDIMDQCELTVEVN